MKTIEEEFPGGPLSERDIFGLAKECGIYLGGSGERRIAEFMQFARAVERAVVSLSGSPKHPTASHHDVIVPAEPGLRLIIGPGENDQYEISDLIVAWTLLPTEVDETIRRLPLAITLTGRRDDSLCAGVIDSSGRVTGYSDGEVFETFDDFQRYMREVDAKMSGGSPVSA